MDQLTPTTPTSAQSAMNHILQNNQDILDAMIQKHVDSWQAFWLNSGATPQQIAAAFGTNAAGLFVGASNNIARINAAYADAGLPSPAQVDPPPPWTGVPTGCSVDMSAGDGTVTITTPTPWPPVPTQGE